MKKIGILGGTFNPPHIGHLMIANEVRHALELDEVRLMPTALSPHKSANGYATAEQRLQMVELAVEGIEGLVASPFEVARGGISYTYDTMEALIELEPESDFHFIIGGDMIDMLSDWYRIEELTKLIRFVGVRRPYSENTSKYPVEIITIPEIYLSSTLVRERFAEGGTVALLTSPAVESFIRKEGLYGCRSAEN